MHAWSTYTQMPKYQKKKKKKERKIIAQTTFLLNCNKQYFELQSCRQLLHNIIHTYA